MKKPTFPRGLNAKTAGDLTPANTNLTRNVEPSIRTIAEVALDMLENKTPNTDVSFAKSFIRDMAHILSQQRAREADCPRHLIDEEYRNKGYKTTNFEQSISFTIVD